MLRRIRTVLVSVLLVVAAVYLAIAPIHPPIRDYSNDPLGYLKHRGKKYWVSDLMDPKFRAASDDRFVRQFDQGLKFADIREDALHRSELFSRPSKAHETHLIPWAGRDLADIPGE